MVSFYFEAFIRLKKSAMIDMFKKISADIKPNENIKNLEATLPIFNMTGQADLEQINPTPPRDVVKEN